MIKEYKYNNGFQDYDSDSKISICLGFFDGLHIGHVSLIKEALKEHGNVGVLTFEGSVKFMTSKRQDDRILTTIEDRKKILESLGVSSLFVVDFTEEIMNMEPEYFIKKILSPLNIDTIYIGKDFNFGKEAKGNSELLSKFFKVNVVPFVLDDENTKVSASNISELIREGNVEKANYLLGRNYTIQGSVVRGLGNGMKMGFPTSNLKLDANYVVPPLGVYATISQFDDETVKRFSMTDIGFHPTIDRLKTISIETNIFGISKETYGRHLKLEFIKYIRPEMKFNTLNDLICQLGKDKSSIEKYFSNKKD